MDLLLAVLDSGCSGYELTANIDLSSFNDGTWDPIGIADTNINNRFTAIFDGNNNTISNLDISSDSDSVGLFSIVSGATIRNLKLATVSVTGNNNVGALAGQATGTTTLSNIELIGDESQSSSTPEIKGSGANVGGLVGNFNGIGTISDASSSLTVRGGVEESNISDTGGLVGNLQNGGSIKNSNSSGSVSALGGSTRIGGLVGNNSGTISNSWASGNISNNGNNNVGGLLGNNISSGVISNSWASGNVSGNIQVGGLVGLNLNKIRNSWASGEVIGNSAIGGLVGANAFGLSIISNSWASGEVTGTSDVGGLVGQLFQGGTINGRNYRLSDGANNIGTKLATTDLAALSGASGGTASTNSEWHAGFDGQDIGTAIDLDTRFCDTDGSGSIETSNRNRHDEQVATNSVWVMPPTANDNVTTNTNEAGVTATYYQIPAIRCIANTAGITDQTTIDAMRKIEIDRQRRKFPNP